MIIRPGDVPEETQDPRPLVLKRVINMHEHGPNLSVTWVDLWGHHERVRNDISDRVYYVLSGEAQFQVGDGAPVETATPGDFVHIPRGVPYEFQGKMQYLVINGPAFRANSDQVLPSAL